MFLVLEFLPVIFSKLNRLSLLLGTRQLFGKQGRR